MTIGEYMKLKGKTVVVTGASSGMGKAIVEVFVKEGANVVAVARRKERLEELEKSLKKASGKILAFVGDVSKKEDNEAMIDFAVEKFGRLDVLVNNAGIMDDMSPIAEATDEKWNSVMATNLYGPFSAMRKACKVFLAQGNGGNIINVSSVGSMHPVAGPVYCASKAGLNTLSQSVAFMYMKEKIRCNVIAPGGINTEISTSMGMPNQGGYAKLAPLFGLAPAPGEGLDIAQTALFLASDDSKYISGVVLAVDGGWTAF